MRVHFIAIGGSIMHDIAITLAKRGYIVSGSDEFIYEPSRSQLEKYKLLPLELGWFPEKIDDQIDAVILGMHSKEDNPELLKAKELGLNIYSYPEFIYEQSIDKIRVVIGGSFGKTTITSMIMHVLKKLGRDFDYIIGAPFEGFEHTVELTKEAPLIIIEGDEYLASVEDKRPKMLIYKANIGLISSISWDHKNVFLTFEDYLNQFKLFIESIEEKGTLVFNKEDKHVQNLVSSDNSNINKHGYRIPEYTINKGKSYINTSSGDIPLQVFGRYNLSNIAGAYSICEWLGVSRNEFYEAIQSFEGTTRRLEYVNGNSDSAVYQDFSYSPIKIKTTIQALKEQYPQKNLISIIELQAHNFLDKIFLKDYDGVLDLADYPVVFINEELVRQKVNFSLSERDLKEAFKNDNIRFINTKEDLETFLRNIDSQQTNLLFINSGNYGGINIVKYAELFIS
jgi:UDP-N-acetylmuramate: L-alanyl-gamma-D-glutamyl-meso-diaminopimelate ligase